MDDKLTQQLNEDYPELFLFHTTRTGSPYHFGVGDGWYNILNGLFLRITVGIRNHNKELRQIEEAMDALDNGKEVPHWILNRIEKYTNSGEWPEPMEFPQIQQIKEKFGSLRVYVSYGDEVVHELIGYAEYLSSVTCEVCGAPGEMRNDRWVKTLCDDHAVQHRDRLRGIDRDYDPQN